MTVWPWAQCNLTLGARGAALAGVQGPGGPWLRGAASPPQPCPIKDDTMSRTDSDDPDVKERAMSDLQAIFAAAANDATKLPKRPDNDTMLQLYALYKQATAGDVSGKRPGFMDMVGQAKYDAWAKLTGTSKEAAMQRYVDLVARLKG